MQSTSYSNLQTEPAFVTNEKYSKARQGSGTSKSLSDCCYSISNLALIVASVVALIFLIKFLQDDLLYDYGEHILSLRFYRELIYVVVVVPLTLLVPLFNAISAFFLYGKDKTELGCTLVKAKIIYQSIMVVLVFIALIFVAPSIRFSNISQQIEIELRRHMQMRYENPFSYEFLDRIQEEYQCCDEIWYRSNYENKMPSTCYAQDGTFSNIYVTTCPVVLGSLVSNWCAIIAACLVAILVCLAILLGIDILDLLAYSSGRYDVGAREAVIQAASQGGQSPPGRRLNEQPRKPTNEEDIDTDDDDILSSDIARRLRLSERDREMERERMALADPSLNRKRDASESSLDGSARNGSDPVILTPLLTRSSYLNNRPLSPVFVDPAAPRQLANSRHNSNTSLGGQSTQSVASSGRPVKGVLKKTSSYQRMDQSDQDRVSWGGTADDTISLHEQQRQIQRELQSRRSLLNVRFAD